MALPVNIIAIRHGESEGNLVNRRARDHDQTVFEIPGFRDRHVSQWRLTDLGREQAQAAGNWLRREAVAVDRGYVSFYTRAMETALYLPEVPWIESPYLREQMWGDLTSLADKDRVGEYQRSLQARETQPFLWTPPGAGAESMDEYFTKTVDRALDTLNRSCGSMSVVLVTHGGWLWGLRHRMERLPQEELMRLRTSDDPHEHIHKCQIIHYTRCNPWMGQTTPKIQWVRSICPWDLSLSSNEWREIRRHVYSAVDLQRLVSAVPQLVK